MGVIEKHADHLPLGTDALDAMAIAERAVKIEPAVIFPFYYFSQIQENKNFPGTIALRHRVLARLSLLKHSGEGKPRKSGVLRSKVFTTSGVSCWP
jgi:creatinine amidohydrolase/Fe(II)-dependent formamide hydrolase-like protein